MADNHNLRIHNVGLMVIDRSGVSGHMWWSTERRGGMALLGYISWNSTGRIGRIGRHRAGKPDVEVTMCDMPPDASDFPGGIPAIAVAVTLIHLQLILQKQAAWE